MLFVSHDRSFLRALSNRVLELGGETGVEREPHVYQGTYIEYVQRTGHEAPGCTTDREARDSGTRGWTFYLLTSDF